MHFTVKEFLAGREEIKKYPVSLQIDIVDDTTTEEITILVEALKSGEYSQEVAIFFYVSISDSSDYPQDVIKILADTLKSGKCPQGFQLVLSGSGLTTENIDILADALTSGKCPQGFGLFLRNNELTTEGVKALADALKSGKCPQGFELHVSNNELTTEGVKALADALTSGKCPQGFLLFLGYNKLTTEGVKALADALTSGKCPQGFLLFLGYNKLTIEGVKTLADALTSGKCPRGLQLNFDAKDFGIQGIRILSAALESGLCPPELQINFSNLELHVGEVERRQLESAWATYHNDQQRKEFLASQSFLLGRLQPDSPVHLLNPDVINHILSFVSPIPVIDKSTKFSAEAFVESYQEKIPPDEKSPAGKELFFTITLIDKKANISERARIIRNAVSEATERKEGKLSSSEIALLQRFHLIPESSIPVIAAPAPSAEQQSAPFWTGPRIALAICSLGIYPLMLAILSLVKSHQNQRSADYIPLSNIEIPPIFMESGVTSSAVKNTPKVEPATATLSRSTNTLFGTPPITMEDAQGTGVEASAVNTLKR